MAVNKNPANFLRRDKASDKVKKVAKRVTSVKYEYVEEEDDIIFLDGPYRGRMLREIFPLGQQERDYVTKELYFLNDSVISRIIISMTYQEV